MTSKLDRETSKILETSKLPQVLALACFCFSSIQIPVTWNCSPWCPSMHLGGGMRGKAWCWLKFRKSARTKGTMISLSTRTRYCRATPVFRLWVYEWANSCSAACSIDHHWITASRGLYMTSPKKEDQCFNPSAGRGEDTSTFTIFTPYQDIEAQGATVLVDETLGSNIFVAGKQCHNGPSASNIMKNQEGPADLMSFNAVLLFLHRVWTFSKACAGKPSSPMEEAEAEVRWEILRDSKVANGRIIRIEAILDSLTLPFFFCSMECVQKTLGASTSWRWFTTLQRWSKSCPLNPLRWPLLDPKRLEDSKSCSNRGTNIYITISSIVPICWNTVYHIY